LDHPQLSYDVISIIQDGGHGIAILSLPVSFSVTSLIYEGRSHTCRPNIGEISQSTIKLLLHYYFHFMKTNVRLVLLNFVF